MCFFFFFVIIMILISAFTTPRLYCVYKNTMSMRKFLFLHGDDDDDDDNYNYNNTIIIIMPSLSATPWGNSNVACVGKASERASERGDLAANMIMIMNYSRSHSRGSWGAKSLSVCHIICIFSASSRATRLSSPRPHGKWKIAL